MWKIRSLRGPVESVGGKLMLRIPLEAGGQDFVECSRGIGVIDGGFLCIHIQEWLAEKLGISEGSVVDIDNSDGTFNIRPAD
jgi:hypothetical protein